MKKLFYLFFILTLTLFNICACNTNQEKTNTNIQNNEINNSNTVTSESELQNNTTIQETTNQNNTTIQESTIQNDNIITDISNANTESENKSTNSKPNTETSSNEKDINFKNQTITVSASSLSNKTNAWGFVRKKNEVRPEFSASYTKVLDEYDGIYAGNSDKKVIYLTFDEGYENGYTADILDTLKEKNCPATFFVTKPYVKQNQELVQRMIDEGHIVRKPYS